jgi:superfamily II RNA helicase
MPIKVKNEAGEELEVLSPEEQKQLEEKVAKIVEYETKAIEYEKKVKELEENVNPKWNEARAKMKQLEEDNKRLAKLAGNPDEPKPRTESDIQEQVAKGILASKIDDALDRCYGDKRGEVEPIYRLLEKNADIKTFEDAKKYIQIAGRGAGLTQENIPVMSAPGSIAPEFKDTVGTKQKFDETDQGKQLLNEFGINLPKA